MVLMPWAAAFFSTAEPVPLSRVTIMRTLTPSPSMPSAIDWNFVLSPWAFWMSYLTPAALKAASRYGRSLASQRLDDAVSGRMTPTKALLAPPDAEEPLPPELLEQAAMSHADTESPARARNVRVRM